MATGAQQPRHCHQKGRIVIDDVDGRFGHLHHPTDAFAIGRRREGQGHAKRTVGIVLRPKSAAMRFDDGRRSTGRAAVLKNASKMRSICRAQCHGRCQPHDRQLVRSRRVC
jgi:hypothetical protein